MPSISEPTLARNGETQAPASAEAAREQVLLDARELIELALRSAACATTYLVFEKELIERMFSLARSVVGLFLIVSEQRVAASLTGHVVRDGRRFRPAPAKERNLLTWFDVVRYRRTYLREVVGRGEPARGFHPLDAELGLLADRVSPNLLSTAVRLATRVSFSEACELVRWFLPTAPSTEVVEGWRR